MLKFEEIRELVRLFDETNVVELNLELEGAKIRLKKAEAVLQTAPSTGFVPALPAVSNQAVAPVPRVSDTAVETTEPQSTAPVAVETSVEEAGIHIVSSPMVGTFYRAPSPDAPPFVERGSKVDEKTVVCIVEAMKLMNEIEAEVKGEVVEVLAENGQLVEYGQPLFKIKVS
ncbi:MAG: acetyl-CoA carboxylase biotin carboxyl carrier protein [Alicyclobacillus herbarius]|uniref:acetyl-CoA carboxylase biotin carboxyl carrier protein n=1 Tax=Alicyclobacillus herbarius TaxID=122960 RepID=UPI000427B08D|nr:acetyl-CoA carboxylase biotin carboxyl carrier protein [Alicyclobacillus herbarius]MCL6631652.1 acetyl-CoA carboxylase biotin carboxyl carrier protein [Alicyclobacillus herbarius]